MQIFFENCVIRPLDSDDAASLAQHANNRRVWRNMRDLFPHPYTLDDARQFIDQAMSVQPATAYAIEIEGRAVGVIGIRLRGDVERINGELGYWLGESYWGCGLMTKIVQAFVPFALGEFNLQRIEAGVFEWNPASARVLEKAGFTCEGIQRRSAIKDGQVIDRWIYAYLAGGSRPGAPGSGHSAQPLGSAQD